MFAVVVRPTYPFLLANSLRYDLALSASDEPPPEGLTRHNSASNSPDHSSDTAPTDTSVAILLGHIGGTSAVYSLTEFLEMRAR